MTTKRLIFYALAFVIIVPLILLLFQVSDAGGDPPHPEDFTRKQALRISIALQSYESMFNRYPEGENPAIFHELTGSNRLQLKFLEPARTNSAGEMLDFWHTPYRIEIMHQTNALIRSAGANRKFGDADDIVCDSVKMVFVNP